jgi:hypothetical protein
MERPEPLAVGDIVVVDLSDESSLNDATLLEFPSESNHQCWVVSHERDIFYVNKFHFIWRAPVTLKVVK